MQDPIIVIWLIIEAQTEQGRLGTHFFSQIFLRSCVEYGKDIDLEEHIINALKFWVRLAPDQDVHFLYARSNFSALKFSKSIFSTNASQLWTPTLEVNTNKKIAKGPQTTGRTDGHMGGQIYYTTAQGTYPPWLVAACSARNYGPRE